MASCIFWAGALFLLVASVGSQEWNDECGGEIQGAVIKNVMKQCTSSLCLVLRNQNISYQFQFTPYRNVISGFVRTYVYAIGKADVVHEHHIPLCDYIRSGCPLNANETYDFSREVRIPRDHPVTVAGQVMKIEDTDNVTLACVKFYVGIL